MLRITKLLIVGAALTLVLSTGCSDRGANVNDRVLDKGGIGVFNHVFLNELLVQIGNDEKLLFMRLYIPGGDFNQEKPLPLLVLLPPQGGDEYYFFNHGLKQVADELLGAGLIEPMAIACISNNLTFGGFFWSGNGGGSGDYDALIGEALLNYFPDTSLGRITDDPQKRGIGGIGQGAYGAFRAVLLHEDSYKSISVADGPLDFDGPDQNSGLISLFPEALAEQGLLGDPDWRVNFDSLSTHPLSRLFIGGSLAFSPHDTLVEPIVFIGGPPEDPQLFIEVPDSVRYTIDDNTTLISNIVNVDEWNFDFHLPFDNNGDPYPLIWDLWLKNNLETILADSGTTRLADVDMWIATTEEQDLTFHEQTASWIQTLKDNNLHPAVYEYSGYDGFPATGDQYLSDLLRLMLIFHSQQFQAADSTGE